MTVVMTMLAASYSKDVLEKIVRSSLSFCLKVLSTLTCAFLILTSMYSIHDKAQRADFAYIMMRK